MNQLSFFETPCGVSVDDRILELETKIANMRSGLFRRYSECEKAIEFLEQEVESLVKETIGANP